MIIFAALLAATFTRPLERVASLDPAFAQSVYDCHAVSLIYDTPLRIDYAARPYRLVPGLCELPEISEDGLTVVFRLRPEAAVTAADMARSLERLRDPQLVTPNGWMLKDVVTIGAPDARTVEFRLRRRNHVFPWLMAMPPASVMSPEGGGTGAYRLRSWRKNHEMVFEKKGEESDINSVRYLVIDDPSTKWLMFLKGEIDLLDGLSRDTYDALVKAAGPSAIAEARKGRAVDIPAFGATLHLSPTLETMYIGINMRDPLLGKNVKLRQALNAAFDFPAWAKFNSERVIEAGGPVPPMVAGALKADSFPYRFDLELAKRLMAEAGYPNGIDPATGRRLTLTMAIGRATQDSREAGELMAAFWERIGIRLELKFYTWEAFVKAVNEGRTQLFRMGWVGDYPDAENFLQLFYSASVSPGPNHVHYVNAAYDREFEAARAALSETERAAHWRRCQEIVREDCPWVFTHFNLASTLVKSRIGGFCPGDFPYGEERFLYEKNDLP